jgi:CRP-like cAMP-binding protein
VALAGLGLFLAAVLAVTVGGLRRADESADVPIVSIRLLRTVPALAMLPPAEMEAVARSASDVSYPADVAIIRQGDVGDRFYVVIEGSVDVERDGTTVATLGRGGQFGEVALIADLPRTATVTSRVPTRLLAIDRDDFLLAVTGHEPSHAAVIRRIHSFED